MLMYKNIFYFVSLVFLQIVSSCSQTSGFDNQVLDANIQQSIMQEFSSKEMPKVLKDTLVSLLSKYKSRHKELNQGGDEYYFWPVYALQPSNLSSLKKDNILYICLDKKANTYFSLEYMNNSNVKINKEFYDATVKVYGKEFADKSVKLVKQDKWVVGHFDSLSPVVLAIQKAMRKANKENVFFYKKLRTLEVGYVMKGKAYTCRIARNR